MVLISGEAGIGKTRLVSEVEAAATGFTVLHGECVEFGGEELALGPVVAALRGEPLPSASGRGQLFELLLERLGQAAPVLLVLEDVHWADAATLALLAFLARNLRDERVVVIATHREDSPELQRLVAELGRRRTVTRIALAAAHGRPGRAPAGGDRRRAGAGVAGGRPARAGGRESVLRRGAVRGADRDARGSGPGADRAARPADAADPGRGGRARDARAAGAAGHRPVRPAGGAGRRRAGRGARRRGLPARADRRGDLRAPAAGRANGAARPDRRAAARRAGRAARPPVPPRGAARGGAAGVDRGGQRGRRASTPTTPRSPTSSGRWSSGSAPPTCSPAPPRPPASAATPRRRSRCAARRSR